MKGQGDVFLDCCRDGTITIREKGEPPFNARALPVYACGDRETAEDLRVAVCSVRFEEHPLLPGKPWYGVCPYDKWEATQPEPPERGAISPSAYLRWVGEKFERVHTRIREVRETKT